MLIPTSNYQVGLPSYSKMDVSLGAGDTSAIQFFTKLCAGWMGL